MMHALVKGNDILEFRDFEPNVDQSKLAPGKARWLPVEDTFDEFDPVTQVREEPTNDFRGNKVVRHHACRAKNADEIAAMIAAKDAAIEEEFARLYCEPVAYTVGGVEYQFHADTNARENITGVLQMYREGEMIGLTIPDPRTWTPLDSNDPIQITRAELAGLGITIGARKDALFAIKKAKQKALAAMTDPAEIDAVDPLTGWDLN